MAWMNRRFLVIASSLFFTLLVSAVLLWLVSLRHSSITLSEFLKSGSRIGLAPESIYINTSPVPDARKLKARRDMAELQKQFDEGKTHVTNAAVHSAMSKDDGVFWGWAVDTESRTLGTITTVELRKGYWINIWLFVGTGLWPSTILVALWVWTLRRRALAGRCHSCGYDLRASKDKCPECGAAIAMSKLA